VRTTLTGRPVTAPTSLTKQPFKPKTGLIKATKTQPFMLSTSTAKPAAPAPPAAAKPAAAKKPAVAQRS
jgi:hypothetical protein